MNIKDEHTSRLWTFIMKGEIVSEDKIIEICKRLIADFKHFQEIREKDKELNIYQWSSYDDIFKEYKQAIQSLLDLYQKEKEKNRLLIEGKFREVADKNSYIKDNYISKDKIKEKIKEYEKIRDEICKKDYDENRVKAINERIFMLQELLGE